MTAKHKGTEPPGSDGSAGRKRGFVKVMYRLRAEQIEAVRTEAFARAKERRVGMADGSEVVREILDGWLKARSKRAAGRE